jgi:hypothetical protein
MTGVIIVLTNDEWSHHGCWIFEVMLSALATSMVSASR